MDKLSDLISEARPLYKTRKRRKTVGKMLLAMTLPVFFLSGLTNLYLQGDAIYVSFDNNKLQAELMQDDFGLLR